LISRRASAILPALVRRSLTLAALAGLALGASACLTPCEELGSRICGCQPAGSIRDACNRGVKSAVKKAKTSEAQQDLCDQQLEACPDPASDSTACDFMSTPAGKEACGLAFPSP
jgi:hypothetical protein